MAGRVKPIRRGPTAQQHGPENAGSRVQQIAAPPKPAPWKGLKQSLPSKLCVACGRPMSWRKRWARTWDAVKFCSAACRNRRGAGRLL